jgi:ABC-type antimicrobial peptide transport system permease subunit
MEQTEGWVKDGRTRWTYNSFQIFVELEPGVRVAQLAPKIKDMVVRHSPEMRPARPEIWLQPYKDWHLYADYKNGKVAGGFIDYVKYNPAYPYSYKFVDEEYSRKFTLELLVGKLAGIFAGLAILISCLGLFGLAAYVAEQRTREVGIRKVLGASVSQVWMLLSKDFMLLVVISCLIASPIAFYFLQGWLLQYDYRISIGVDVFLYAAMTAMGITLLTISWQAIRAALANPINSLRTE